jgi:hypothetical protein
VDWRDWTFSQWNEAILERFFRKRQDDQSETVSRFLMVAESFSQATCDPNADPEEALDAFEEAVRQSMRNPRDRSEYLDLITAMHMVEVKSRWSPQASGTPPFLSHLFLTCVAASISDEERRDERSFHRRLKDILKLNGLYRQALFTDLPRFWKLLADWTERHQNDLSVKRLVLPKVLQTDAKHLIAYSEKLSFPDRRDVPILARALESLGPRRDALPPVAAVVNAVIQNQTDFSQTFCEAFEEFLTAFHERAPGLSGHRFWSTVVEAHQRARGPEGTQDGAEIEGTIELFGEEEEIGTGIRLFLGTRGAEAPKGLARSDQGIPTTDGSIFPIFREGLSPYVLVDELLGSKSVGLLEQMPQLRRQVEQGVVPLGRGVDGFLVLTGRDLGSATHAVVRKDLVTAVLNRFGGTSAPYSDTGWFILMGSALDFLPRDFASTDPLAHCWCLQENLEREEGISVDGGVQCGASWLWMAGMLPKIHLRGALGVVVSSPDGEIQFELSSNDRCTWTLPENHRIRGAWMIRGAMEDGARKERRISFIDSPAKEAPKPPTEPAAWLVESLNGVIPQSDNCRSEHFGEDPSDWMQDSIYLGRNVGDFVHERASAVWEVSISGDGNRRLQFLNQTTGYVPDRMVSDKGMRRKWRQLFQWVDPADSRTLACKHEIQDFIAGRARLETTKDFTPWRPAFNVQRTEVAQPVDALENLVNYTVASGNARAGLRPIDWLEAIKKLIPGLEKGQEWQLLNAWQGAGYLDMLQFLRWNKSAIFPRGPRLLLVDSTMGTLAYLDGLALATTVDGLGEEASKRGLHIREIGSPWPMLPKRLTLCGDEDSIRGAARMVGIPVEMLRIPWLDGPSETIESRRGGPPFRGYKLTTKYLVTCHRLPLSLFETDNAPRIWAVEVRGETRWSHSRTLAEALLLSAHGRTPFRGEGRRDIVADGCRLPLPIARTAALLGEFIAYPSANGEWRYSFPSEAMRDKALAATGVLFEANGFSK